MLTLPLMPNRILRDSITESESLALLTAEAERFFYRLLSKAYDYGRFDARSQVLRAQCFKLMLDQVSEANISQWLNELSYPAIGIIKTYSVNGRAFGYFINWTKHQRTARSVVSKYPDPAEADPQPVAPGADNPDRQYNNAPSRWLSRTDSDRQNNDDEKPSPFCANTERQNNDDQPLSTLSLGIGIGIEDGVGDVTPLNPPMGDKKVKRNTEVDEPFRERMRQKYSAALGDDVDDMIAEALGHKARLKRTDLQAYVNGWLRRERQRVRTPAQPKGAIDGKPRADISEGEPNPWIAEKERLDKLRAAQWADRGGPPAMPKMSG
jgi:hypothetical protein